jgi:hypothetical protein
MKAALGRTFYPKDHPVLQRIKLRKLGLSLLLGLGASVLIAVIFWVVFQPGSGSTHGSSNSSSQGSGLPFAPIGP